MPRCARISSQQRWPVGAPRLSSTASRAWARCNRRTADRARLPAHVARVPARGRPARSRPQHGQLAGRDQLRIVAAWPAARCSKSASRSCARRTSHRISSSGGRPLSNSTASSASGAVAEAVAEQRRVPQHVGGPRAGHAQRRDAGPDPPRTVVAHHQVADAGAGQRAEQGVAPDAGEEAAQQERGDHRLHLVALAGQRDRADREDDVLDDLEAEPDQRAVDHAVQHAVDLGAGDQHDGHDAERLGDLLDRRAGQRGAPVGGQVRRAELGDQVLQRRAARDGHRGGDQAAPGEGHHAQLGRLAFEEVQLGDEEPERHGEEREQHHRGQRWPAGTRPANRTPDLRHPDRAERPAAPAPRPQRRRDASAATAGAGPDGRSSRSPVPDRTGAGLDGGQRAAQVELGAADGDLDGQVAGEEDGVPAAAAGRGVAALQTVQPGAGGDRELAAGDLVAGTCR